LPTFGLPASAMNPERVEAGSAVLMTPGLPDPAHQLGLKREHLAVIGLVIHPA
jgi:hypothetical protein